MPVSVYQRRHPAQWLDARGFTLIDLVVVIAILAAIAIPNYSEYIVRSNRPAVQSFVAGSLRSRVTVQPINADWRRRLAGLDR